MDDMIAYVDENGMISDTPPDPAKKKVKLEDIKLGVPDRESSEDIDPIRKGTVTFFNDSKGYGFIKDLETKESVFVHANNLLEEIKEGNITKIIPKKTLKIGLIITVRYNPIFANLFKYKIEDNYVIEWGSLESYPSFEDHPILNCWNKRNDNFYIYKTGKAVQEVKIIKNDDFLIVDGLKGEIIINPSNTILDKNYKFKYKKYKN